MTLTDTTFLALIVCYLVELSGVKQMFQRVTGKADILPLTSAPAMVFIVCTTAHLVAGSWTLAVQAFICLLSALSITFCRLFLFIGKRIAQWFTRKNNLKY